MLKTLLRLIPIIILLVIFTGFALADEYKPSDPSKPDESDSENTIQSGHFELIYFPDAFGLEKGDGSLGMSQARVFISPSGSKKRRATENHLDVQFAVSDEILLRAAKRFSTLSGSTSVIQLESSSFGLQYKLKSKPDSSGSGNHGEKNALACGLEYDLITADPFVIDGVAVLLSDAKTWGLYLAYAENNKDNSETHYIIGYAKNKMAAGRGQCVYGGIGYISEPSDNRFRWGVNGKLFKDFQGWHATGLGQGTYSFSDHFNAELQLGLMFRGAPMTGVYFSDAAAISMNFNRESSFQNVKGKSFPYVVFALTYDF